MTLSIKDLDLKGKKVLMRVDFNVPIDPHGNITDDTRIRLAIPSIQYALDQEATVILMSHFGRPDGKINPELSLKPCADRLSELLERGVELAPDCVGEEVKHIASQLGAGEVLLLENLRFHKGEQYPEKEPAFAKELSELGDVYVNDAFGSAHRKHSSTFAITQFFPEKSAMGLLVESELSFLSRIVLEPKRPFYAIIGGAKIGTKLGVLKALLKKIDALFIGGGMAFTFLKGEGISIGDSICDDEKLEEGKQLLEMCRKKGIEVYLPEDFVITNGKSVQINRTIPQGWKGMDIGPKTVENWSAKLEKGVTIFWNGPMGVFEEKPFSHGTHRLAQNLSMTKGTVIVGGGDSIAAINLLGLEKGFAHLSTGGGATLEFIEYGHLVGIDALS
ncbi:phosphoglycerate kinase [Candidatus Neptunochlamydia vexilliferae]|uniref:Phosphoglycerate kinase n=1 Tax=Candidatus Neptunichlamydia vexilliferae TaxID=1651774 RepID=A0ABS0AZ22_9BACT|nr:phosphoglycerate kinase [Candidatus Neptunochlamydia vexilliferae]MBF5058731.1 Phosphoglycerate kinase [Candidatus Neptunochlamydia vexilliferae]